MIVQVGCEVILVDTEMPHLRPHIGSRWKVKTVLYGHPARAIITQTNLEASVFIKHLDVIPPKTSPFDYDDVVRIEKGFSHVDLYHCKNYLIGKIGNIRGYDYRNQFYYVKCNSGGYGWFPAQCLVPLDFKGERFFYPFETVMYKDEECTISEVQRSRFKWGQLLLLDGVWVPSTDAKPLTP